MTGVKERASQQATRLEELLQEMPVGPQRTLRRITKNTSNASGWLSVLPLKSEGFDLSSTQFRDQLAIRYHHEPAGLPAECEGCGAPFSLQHGLDCKKGGLVKKGHNDLCDNDAQLADIAWGGVSIEPVLTTENDRCGRPQLHPDWMAKGVWEGNQAAFFDNRIIDADAPSYVCSNLSWKAISNRAAKEKKGKYYQAAEDLHGSITPLVCSTDGAMHQEHDAFQKRL